MHIDTAARLVDLNHQFYQSFASAFAATRRRIQPGVRRIIQQLPLDGNWLDLGCGSGALAADWARAGRKGSYLGLDFSAELLEEARRGLPQTLPENLKVDFSFANLVEPGWPGKLPQQSFNGVLAFAVLHHLPGLELRTRVMRQVHSLLVPGGLFIHSNWQFQHSPRLMARRQPWQTVGLAEADVEAGDTLLDWRYTLPGEAERTGLRYVHLFSRLELEELAALTGFDIFEEFESDGEGGRLGLYQTWRVNSSIQGLNQTPSI